MYVPAPQRTQLPQGQDHHLLDVLTWTDGLTVRGQRPHSCCGMACSAGEAPAGKAQEGALAQREGGPARNARPPPGAAPPPGGQEIPAPADQGHTLAAGVGVREALEKRFWRLLGGGLGHHRHHHHRHLGRVLVYLSPQRGPENGCTAGAPAVSLARAPESMSCWTRFGHGVDVPAVVMVERVSSSAGTPRPPPGPAAP
jgi:hypothetical protein